MRKVLRQAADRRKKLIVLRRICLPVLCVYTALHLFATFLWVGPVTPMRSVWPGNTLEQYMVPMFRQSWSVFAPTPGGWEIDVSVRAKVTDDGNTRITDWVSASDAGNSRFTHNPFPPRTSRIPLTLGLDLYNSYYDLNKAQQNLITHNFPTEQGWQKKFSTNLVQLSDKDQKTGAKKALDYLVLEKRAIRYATQVAYAIWGEDVTQVQIYTAKQDVMYFYDRNNKYAERPAAEPIPVGWRPTIAVEEQDQELFADYFCSADTHPCQTR